MREVRRKKQWRQAAFAEAFGVSRTTISNIERGKQRIWLDQVVWAAQILDVSVSELVPSIDDLKADFVVHAAVDDPIPVSAERNLAEVVRGLVEQTNKPGQKTR